MSSTNPAVWRAQSLFDTYTRVSGPHYGEPEQTVLEDIIADLHDFAAAHGLDWTTAVDMAEGGE